jgi:hypothetical protein
MDEYFNRMSELFSPQWRDSLMAMDVHKTCILLMTKDKPALKVLEAIEHQAAEIGWYGAMHMLSASAQT